MPGADVTAAARKNITYGRVESEMLLFKLVVPYEPATVFDDMKCQYGGTAY